MTVITELDVAKQELRKLRQDCDVSLDAKVAAFKQEAEAKDAAKANVERVSRGRRRGSPTISFYI